MHLKLMTVVRFGLLLTDYSLFDFSLGVAFLTPSIVPYQSIPPFQAGTHLEKPFLP